MPDRVWVILESITHGHENPSTYVHTVYGDERLAYKALDKLEDIVAKEKMSNIFTYRIKFYRVYNDV